MHTHAYAIFYLGNNRGYFIGDAMLVEEGWAWARFLGCLEDLSLVRIFLCLFLMFFLICVQYLCLKTIYSYLGYLYIRYLFCLNFFLENFATMYYLICIWIPISLICQFSSIFVSSIFLFSIYSDSAYFYSCF